MKNQRLIASNIAGTSLDLNTDHPMYKEFMDFIKSKKGDDSTALADDNNENIEVYNQNERKEFILFLEQSDLKWKNNPWQIMQRYFDTLSYATPTYKYRMHYEVILFSTNSAEF